MATETKATVVAFRGGSFLIEDHAPADVFTPGDFSEEQRMIGETAAAFMENEMAPRIPEILALKYEVTRELLRKAGELGLLGIEIPEEYGGMGLDKVSGCIASEAAARDGSFAVSYMGHTGIGTLPIVYFGTPEQKQKYLPKFASGEWISSYSLSEASSASDAMNAKARAVLSPDGQSWVVNGEKMWLTNAGFADVYITTRACRASAWAPRRRRPASRAARRGPSSCRTRSSPGRTCWARSARDTRSRSTSSTSDASSWARA
jgi:butyryl-CoA dehydrogenase